MALQRASVERPLANAVAEQAKVSEGKLAEFAKELLREEDKVVEALHAQLHRAEAGGWGSTVRGARSARLLGGRILLHGLSGSATMRLGAISCSGNR